MVDVRREDIPAFSRHLDEPWKTHIRDWSGRYCSPIAGNAMTVDTSLGGRFTREPYPLDSHDGVVQIMAEVTPERRLREYHKEGGCVIACPWHGWESDLRTGVALWNPRYRLRRYEVREDAAGNLLVVI